MFFFFLISVVSPFLSHAVPHVLHDFVDQATNDVWTMRGVDLMDGHGAISGSGDVCAETLDWREELKQIDAEIVQLEEQQNRLKLSIARAEDAGNRWQFQKDMQQEAKRAFQKAEADKKELALVQQHIAALQARRTRILQDHPTSSWSQEA